MSKRKSRIKNLKLKKLILIAIIAISLIVIYTFRFITKSEPTVPTLTAKFTEKGTSSVYESDLEIHRDETGSAYIILPEKVQNAYASQFYKSVTVDPLNTFSGKDVTFEEVDKTTDSENNTNSSNTTNVANNTVTHTETNTIINTNQNILVENSQTAEKDDQDANKDEATDENTNTIQNTTVTNENIESSDTDNTNTTTNTIASLVEQASLDEISVENTVGANSKAIDNTVSNNSVSDENADNNTNETSEVTNTVADETSNTTNTVVTNNTELDSNTISNTVTNTTANINTSNTTTNQNVSNTIAEENKHIVEDLRTSENITSSNTVVSGTTSENQMVYATTLSGTDGTVESLTYVPNSKYYLTEDEEASEEVEFEIDFQTMVSNNTTLYNQELISALDGTEVSVKGYIPMGYSLNLTTISNDDAEGYISDVEEFANSEILVAKDITISDANGNIYQPLNFTQTVEVTFKSQQNIQGKITNNSAKVVHVIEQSSVINLEKIALSDVGKDYIKFITNEFSPYVLLAEPPILPDSVTIDDYTSDYNYYMGSNYTQTIAGTNKNLYTDANMAKVTINYYGYDPEYRVSQLSTETASWSSTAVATQDDYTDSDGTTKTIYTSTITANVNTSGNGFIDTNSSWQLEFSVPSGVTLVSKYVLDNNQGKISDVVHDTSSNTVTISNSTLANWTENSATSYTISFNIAFESNTGITAPATSQFTANKAHLIGRVSATERQTLFTYIKAVPIDSSGNILLELIDNPYMDRPKGTGFDGWATHNGNVNLTLNANTYVQTLTMNANGSKELTIDLYANWVEANVIFISSSGANGNSGYSENAPKNTTAQAAGILDDNYKYATNASDRELNIVVLLAGNYTDFDSLNDTDLAFTFTSLYNGTDYRSQSSFQCSNTALQINNDLQLHHLNWGKNGLYYAGQNGNNTLTNRIVGNTYNLRIGRGMVPINANYGTFAQVLGGNAGASRPEYRLVIETGKYTNIQLGRAYTYSTNYNSSGTIIYGCDFDRISENNEDLKVYLRTSSRTGGYDCGPGIEGNPAHFLNIKSGSIGMDTFTPRDDDFAYSGIYVGGVGYAGDDNGDRVLLVEGGDVANIIGGLGTATDTTVLTRIYVKGGSVQNIVGGAGLTQTYGDRIIQVTGGTIAYSISGGSNGYLAETNSATGNNGRLNGNTLVYVGGNAEVGTVANTETLYNVNAGCVLGAGNGRQNYQTYSGLVFSSHVIIDGEAKINNCVYGGGNYGRVAAVGGGGTPVVEFTNVTSDFEAGVPYIIANGNGTGYAMAVNGTTVARVQVDDTVVPSDNMIWYLEDAGNGMVYIKSETGVYLYGNNNGTLSFTNTPSRAFTITRNGNSVRIYYTGNRTYYLRHSNSRFSFSTYASNLYLLKYELLELEEDDGYITNVDIFGGTIVNDAFAGANNNNIEGAVYVKMTNGTVNGTLYGGSNTDGTINGESIVDISGGNIGDSSDAVFGGGQGTDTSMAETTTVKITDASNDVNIYGAIYGGSALGHVEGNTTVTVEDKTSLDNSIFISGYIFGGGKGEDGDPATNNGNCTVTVDGGSYPYASAFGGCNINGNIEGAVLVKIGETVATYINEVYGGGNESGITTDTDSVFVYLYSNTTVENAFNGGNSAGIDGTAYLNNGTFTGTVPRAIYVQGATVRQSVFGGSNSSGELVNSFVYCSNDATVANVFGGGKGIDTTISGNTIVDVQNSYITNNVYGGGDQGVVNGTTSVTINNSQVVNTVYGGGNGADIAVNGINPGQVGGAPSVTITNSIVNHEVFGGGKGATALTNGNTTITITDSEIYNTAETTSGNVYGGGDLGQVNGTSTINITSSKVGNAIYGGGNNANLTGSTSVSLTNNSEANFVYGGGNNGAIGAATAVSIQDSTINDTVYGGGNKGAVTGNTTVSVLTSKVANAIFGGGQAANVNATSVTVSTNSETGYIYGGGDQGEVVANTNVTVSDTIVNNNIYGGGNGAVEITGSTIPGKVGTTTTLDVSDSTAYQIFGGGRGATAVVDSDIDLIIKNSQVTNDIYGGGDNGSVGGSTSVGITDAAIGGSAYAAGNGATAIVAGNSYIFVEGSTTIEKSLFGGGNAAPTGETEASNVIAIVDVAGAEIGENVYGGANSSVIYGDTIVNIGNQAINDYYGLTQDQFAIGKIDIAGTVYGGGEQMDPTKEFNFDTISVTGTITINVDGQGYDTDENTIYIHGSIFGSGNASSAKTNGDIYIKNYGNADNPKRGISLQRATIVEILNSAIVLNGTTDSTSLHPDGYFTLNRIADFRIINNTTMFLRNGANLVAAFDSLYRDTNGQDVPASVEIVDTVTDSDGNTHEVINGKIFDGDEIKYYIQAGVIYDAENGTEIAKVETVENATSITKNTDNRIYMYSGINLNLANDENLKEAFSNVTGMTYFGLYKASSIDEAETDLYMGIYDPDYPVGTEGQNGNGWIEWNDRSYNRSYVLGLHRTTPTEQDIAVDGFYTTYEKFGIEVEDNESLTEDNYESHQVSSYISYITPTPEQALHYMWYAGPDQETYYYTFNMIASKHSSFGTHELNLLDLSFPNATLTVLSDELEPSLVEGVGLYDKSEIPNINPNIDEANNKYGITMKSGNSGWSMVGETDYYYNPDTSKSSLNGDTIYTIENSTTTPTLFFIFYHSNNLTESRELGYYKINMRLDYWRDSLNMGQAEVIIDIALSSEVYTDLGYNGAIAPGSQYDIFTSTPTNITTESSFSTYFELAQANFYEIENIKNYYEDSYRVITTQYVFPVNTTITMIDRYDRNNPQYYYYIVTQDDVDAGRNQYKFTDFLAMGSTDKNYDEIAMRDKYYISENGLDYEYENFIFIVDFANADFVGVDENTFEVVSNQLFRIYLNVMIDGKEETLFGLLDDQIDTIKYGIYNTESTIEIDASLSKPKIYLGNEVYLNIDTQYNVTNKDAVSIYDTRYFDKKLGVKLTISKKVPNTLGADDDGDGQIDEADEDDMYAVVTGASLLGTYFELNGVKYYPRADGTTRIKVAELVSNASSQIKIGTENSTIITGEYKILVESFGSADGIYFGIEASASDTVYMEIINDEYGLNVTLPEEQAIIDKATGFTLDASEDRIGYVSDGNNTLDFTVDYISGLNNPYITVSLYRRNYDEANPYDRTYTKVDMQDYVQETLEEPMEIDKTQYNESDYEFIDSVKQFYNEYTAFDTTTIKAKVGNDILTPVTFNDLSYTLKDNLTTGTYKVVFTVYDTNATIIENIVVDEETGNNVAIQYNRTEYEPIGDSFAYIIIK